MVAHVILDVIPPTSPTRVTLRPALARTGGFSRSAD